MFWHASNWAFYASPMVLIIAATIWSSYGKILSYPYKTQNMANLRNTVTHLWIIIHSFSYGAFYLSAILKLFRYNSHVIFEILSYASNSSFLASFIVLTITASF